MRLVSHCEDRSRVGPHLALRCYQKRLQHKHLNTKLLPTTALGTESSQDTCIVCVACADIESGKTTVLVSGADFYSNPRLSQDGTKLAWVCWDHPNMPWDDTTLYIADVAKDGGLTNHRKVRQL